MSKLLANQIANYNDNGPVEVKEGINIPTGKPLQVAGGAGTTGQYLKSTGSAVAWESFPSIPAAQVQTDWNATSGLGQILNKPALATVATTGSYTDLTNQPTIPAGQIRSDWNATSGISVIDNKPALFDGQYTSLTGAPSVPSTVNDLADVNIPSPVDGQYVMWDQATTRWIQGAGSAGILNVVEDTTPQLGGTLDANGKNIDMGNNTITDDKVGEWDAAYAWGNHTAQGYLTTYTNTTYSQQAVASAGGGVSLRLVDSGGAQDDITISAGTGITLDQIGTEGFRINSTGGGGGGGGATVTTSDAAPSTPTDGDLWWKSNEGRLKVFYDDGSGTQWVDASPPLLPSFTEQLRDASGTAQLNANGNQFELSGHIIPSADAQYDLGDAEHKIRHLFLSDNSCWFGDGYSRISTVRGKIKYYNRDVNKIPSKLKADGITFSIAKTLIEQQLGQGFPGRTWNQISDFTVNHWLYVWCLHNNVPSGTYSIADMFVPEYTGGISEGFDGWNVNPEYDPDDFTDAIEFGQNGKREAPFLTSDAEEYKLLESDTFIRSNVLNDFPVLVKGCTGVEKNYFDMTIFVPQGNTPRTIANLIIDGATATQIKITGTPEANTTQTFKINGLFLGAEWKATVAIG